MRLDYSLVAGSCEQGHEQLELPVLAIQTMTRRLTREVH